MLKIRRLSYLPRLFSLVPVMCVTAIIYNKNARSTNLYKQCLLKLDGIALPGVFLAVSFFCTCVVPESESFSVVHMNWKELSNCLFLQPPPLAQEF